MAGLAWPGFQKGQWRKVIGPIWPFGTPYQLTVLPPYRGLFVPLQASDHPPGLGACEGSRGIASSSPVCPFPPRQPRSRGTLPLLKPGFPREACDLPGLRWETSLRPPLHTHPDVSTPPAPLLAQAGAGGGCRGEDPVKDLLFLPSPFFSQVPLGQRDVLSTSSSLHHRH